ncbi:MAG: hypothetical protein HY819_01280 [Acidobacteria bacterium]|nr:hypothetical protein [Acidobacteriota bacterium]
MSSNQIVIKKKSPATRCDICHMSDQFDSDTETCLRCSNVLIPASAIYSPPTMDVRPIDEVKSFQQFASKFIAYSFLAMVGSIFLTILFGLFQILPLAFIFAVLSFFLGGVFIISLGIFVLYMAGTLLASLVQNIYDSLRARS